MGADHGLTNEQLLFGVLPGPDYGAADRALRELVDRGPGSRPTLLAYAANPTLPTHVRLLGIQGARQFWNDEVEASMVNLLADPSPRSAASPRRLWPGNRSGPNLGSSPACSNASKTPTLGSSARSPWPSAATARPTPGSPGRSWSAGSTPTRRPTGPPGTPSFAALERLGDVGVDEVALAVRTRRGTEREEAVRMYSALRSAHAAEELPGLIKIPDLPGPSGPS